MRTYAPAPHFPMTQQERVGRKGTPHLRCGICDLEFEPGERGMYVDDERCHVACAEGEVEYDEGRYDDVDFYDREIDT